MWIRQHNTAKSMSGKNKPNNCLSLLDNLDSWINIDQLDVTRFIISLFTAQHVSNVSTSIFSSLRLIVALFHGSYCSGSMCVGVTVWFGWDEAEACIRIPHHPSRTTP